MKIPPRSFSVSAVLVLSMAGLGLVATPAQADGPGSGTPYVVTVGDSYISGEAGRWAGSSNNSEAPADALGAHAYHDNASGTAELIPRCHRSRSAEAYIGGGVGGLNLACSGARTTTSTGDYFKPGLDFYDNGAGRLGQAKMLQQFAASHNVKQVVVSIGGNDFNFASIVTQLRDRLPAVAVVEPGLLQGRLLGGRELHLRERDRRPRKDRDRVPERP